MKIEELSYYQKSFGKFWDGKQSILEMKDNNYNQWRQMEWAGFYLQYIVSKTNQKDHFLIPGRKIYKTVFDAHWIPSDFPIDVKFHSNLNNNGKHNLNIPLNDCESMDEAINLFGEVGIIVLFGDPEYDTTGEFKIWHDSIKGEKSEYVKKAELENKNSRMRKTAINLTHINYYSINESNVNLLDGFQKGMINSNGTLRNEKYRLDTSKFQPLFTIKY